jgi:hypothetical protein
VGGSLDTLNELSKALNDDSQFASTVTNMISSVSAAKQNKIIAAANGTALGNAQNNYLNQAALKIKTEKENRSLQLIN